LDYKEIVDLEGIEPSCSMRFFGSLSSSFHYRGRRACRHLFHHLVHIGKLGKRAGLPSCIYYGTSLH